MPSPTTPRFSHSRANSSVDYNSPQIERRQSRSSTVGDTGFGAADGDISMFSNSGLGGGNGLGNLADELAEALSDGEDEYYEGGDGAPPDISLDAEGEDGGGRQDGIRDSGVDVASPNGRGKHMSLALPPTTNGRGHRRKHSEYDGSEYGSDSDLDSPGMPSSLVAKMDAVESLARRGIENSGGPADGVFQRVTESLRDLSSQSAVEGNATRLITAHTALTTHVTHQTRHLHNLTFPLLNPLAPPPDPETVDALLPEITALMEQIPKPTARAYQSLADFHRLTDDLNQTLSVLSDTLQMSRQTTTTATRRLKSARELVAEMRRDDELREEGERWLTRGNWGERLATRECASVCGDVVGGFEEVCNGWRARLLAHAESVQA